MKKIYLIICMALVVSAQAKKQVAIPEDAYLIDSMKAVVFSVHGNEVITESDVARPNIDGSQRTFEEKVFEALVYNQAKEYHMIPAGDAIEAQLNSIMRENHINKDQMYEIFLSAGYTPEEGKDQFARLSAFNTVIDVKIRSRLLIPERELRAYYDAHPEYEEEAYCISRGLVAIDAQEDTASQQKTLEDELTQTGKIEQASWTDAFWITKPELAVEKSFIADMKVSEIRFSGIAEDGFEFFKVEDRRERRLKTFEERFNEISNMLRRPRYQTLFDEFRDQLFRESVIIYF